MLLDQLRCGLQLYSEVFLGPQFYITGCVVLLCVADYSVCQRTNDKEQYARP